MNQTKCSYHPEAIAVDKCERCQRPICLEGKRVYHKQHSRGTGASRRSWSTRHIYCPPCHADVATMAATGPGAILSGLLFVIIGIIITGAFASFGGPFVILPLLVIVLGIIQMMNKAQKADQARKDEQEFLNELNTSPQGVKQTKSYSKFKSYSRPDKSWSLSEVSCFNCGDKLELKANYCMNCGDPTTDEKEYFENQK